MGQATVGRQNHFNRNHFPLWYNKKAFSYTEGFFIIPEWEKLVFENELTLLEFNSKQL